MEWLDGHPLSMRLILPHLDTTDPGTLLDGLRGTAPLPGEKGTEGSRTTSLAASIAYSYRRLSATTRRRLAVVSLFQGVADVAVLAGFSLAPGIPARFAGTSAGEWRETLNDAARVGLLSLLGANMYQIHPALPGYLAAQLATEEPSGHAAIRDTATYALLTAYAGLGVWLDRQISSGDAGLAFTVIHWQRRTMGGLLAYALDHQLWDEVRQIAQPFHEYWRARGLKEEADAWTDRVRLATEDHDGTAPPLDTSAGALWLLFAGTQANQQLNSHHLDQAERTYQQILTSLGAQRRSSRQQLHLAGTYHQLGRVAQTRESLDDAEDWYTKSLAINEELGNRPGMAISYHQLGIVAQERGRLDEADDWYTKSLAIEEDLGNEPGMAVSYHQLGNTALLRERLDDAEDWYTKSLAINEELGNRPSLAKNLAQMAWLAEQRGQSLRALEQAIRSVSLFEQVPNPATGSAPAVLARLTGELGAGVLEACWREVTGEPLPQAVRDYVDSATHSGDA
jgi:tetratricopeptide (TPR) repeat protein